MGGFLGSARRAFSSQTIASSVRDYIKWTNPSQAYLDPMWGARGLRPMACSVNGIASSSEPVRNLQIAGPISAGTALRLNASTASYSGIASSHRRCARRRRPLAKCALGLNGDVAKACRIRLSARSRLAPAESGAAQERTTHKRVRQPALRLDRPRVESQRMLV